MGYGPDMMNHMNKEELAYFKEKLESELVLVEQELSSVGRKNPSNVNDWEPVPATMDVLNADENEVADTIEEFEGNTAILKQLEIRYNEIKRALEKINSGGYGICEVSGETIERERLEANPAARTSKKHMGEEGALI